MVLGGHLLVAKAAALLGPQVAGGFPLAGSGHQKVICVITEPSDRNSAEAKNHHCQWSR